MGGTKLHDHGKSNRPLLRSQGIHTLFEAPPVPALVVKKSKKKDSEGKSENKKEKRKIEKPKPKPKTKRVKQPKIDSFFQKK